MLDESADTERGAGMSIPMTIDDGVCTFLPTASPRNDTRRRREVDDLFTGTLSCLLVIFGLALVLIRTTV
jgi:hypothetical protein